MTPAQNNLPEPASAAPADAAAAGAAAADAPEPTAPPAGSLALNDQLLDALLPGFQGEWDPEEAARIGAFLEDALDESDALGSSDDLQDAQP